MSSCTPQKLLRYVSERLHLQRYLAHPGDGRLFPQKPACALLWSLLFGRILRKTSFHAIEFLVRSPVRRTMQVSCEFCDDTLGYFIERLHPTITRQALCQVVRQAKRNKAFDDTRFIGLAIDGTHAGQSEEQKCALCRPHRNKKKEITGYHHAAVCISVVGVNLSLPFDVEPYGPGDSEYAAGQRLLARAVENIGKRFAFYVVVDGKFATAPFLHATENAGLYVVARLKSNLPELYQAVRNRFENRKPHSVHKDNGDIVEIWDSETFEPWETLNWDHVRVIKYRQQKADRTVVEAMWLTNVPKTTAGSFSLYRMCKSRWEIENQGFNDAKNRYGLEHVAHQEANSVVMNWLLILLAIVIERMFRLRFLHRGNHPTISANELSMMMWFGLGMLRVIDSS